MAWKNIPEKKVLATLKDGKDFKGTAAEKMTIYVDGGVPGGDGNVQGISMTIDPSTYVMTTQLKDGEGGNVGSPATIDLPLESMVVGGEYDEENKSIILTLSNGQTVEFSVADLVSGLQTEITSENPLSADLIEETNNNKVMTASERTKLSGIAAGAEVNVQADWNQTNSSADDYIKNKPESLGESVIYFNAESSGYILGVENIAFYKDAQLTEEMTPAEMFQLTNKGPVNLIGMFDDGSGFIPWSSEIIVSAADDGMDGQGDSFFFRVLEGPTTGTVAYYGNKWHIGDKMIFPTVSDVDGLVKKGSGAPTTSTTGEKGQLYEDTTNGKVYICTGVDGGVYTWTEIIAKDRVKTLTTADYNYPTSGTKTSIALWLLPSGVYDIGEALTYNANINNTTTTYGKDECHFIIIYQEGVATAIDDLSGMGIWRYSTNSSTGAKEGFARLAFVDDLNTTDTSRGLTANQGKVLNEKIPVITMTSTDPGEGVSLPANNFIAVYSAN